MSDDTAPELTRRLLTAARRIDDRILAAIVGPVLLGNDLVAVFALMLHDNTQVVVAAHECAIIRLSSNVAVVARVFAFDELTRDDLAQRTFVGLPKIVERTVQRGAPITHPDKWIRQRAYNTARLMLREELGTIRLDPGSGEVLRDASGRMCRTRGVSLSLDAISATIAAHGDGVMGELERAGDRTRLGRALKELANERPLWAKILGLHYLRGITLADVARMTGRSHGTVRNDAQRARSRLAIILRDGYPDLVPQAARRREGP